MTLRRIEPVAILGWTMVTAGLAFGDLGGAVRTAFAVVFVAVVPGLALARVLRLDSLELRLLLAVPLSLSLAAIVSALLVYGGVPSWDLGLTILMSGTIAAVTIDLTRPVVKVPRIPTAAISGKLEDDARQARIIDTLLANGTLEDAAESAEVSLRTLQRGLQRSPALRQAVWVASGGRHGSESLDEVESRDA